MNKIVCTISAAAVLLGTLSGCGMLEDHTTDDIPVSSPSPMPSGSPVIVMPDPENGEIEDGNGGENGTKARPSASARPSVSPSPGNQNRG